MRAARLVEIAQPLVIDEVPDPTPGPREAIVKVAVEGICRTDWHTWQGDWSWVGLAPPLPITMGHEFAGEVDGGGQRGHGGPAPETGSPCRSTRPAASAATAGRTRRNLCDAMEFLGMTHDGGYAQYVRVVNADLNCVALPEAGLLRGRRGARLPLHDRLARRPAPGQAAGRRVAGRARRRRDRALGRPDRRGQRRRGDRRRHRRPQARRRQARRARRSPINAREHRRRSPRSRTPPNGGADLALGGLGTASLVHAAVDEPAQGRPPGPGRTDQQGGAGHRRDPARRAHRGRADDRRQRGQPAHPPARRCSTSSATSAWTRPGWSPSASASTGAQGVLERMTSFDTIGFALIEDL